MDERGAVPEFGVAESETVRVGNGQEFTVQDAEQAAGQAPFAAP